MKAMTNGKESLGVREVKPHIPSKPPIDFYHCPSVMITRTARRLARSLQDTMMPYTRETKPPPIFIYGVVDYKAMVGKLSTRRCEETYPEALSNNTIKVQTKTSDAYRNLIRYLREENTIHHIYQLKEDRAYRANPVATQTHTV